MSDAVRDTIVVAADLDTVFEVVSEVERYPDWQDEILEVEVLERDEAGRASRVWFRIDAKVFKATYTLAYDYDVRDGERVMSWDLVEGDQLRELSGVYHLTDQGDGSTDVAYELTVTPAIRLPGMVRRRAARRIIDGALGGVKRRAEAA